MMGKRARPARNEPRGRVRVAHVVQNLDVGGLERIVVTLMEHVDKSTFSSSVYCLQGGGACMRVLLTNGHRAVALQKKPGIDCVLPFRLARTFGREKVDIVHCHNFGAMFYGALAGRISHAAAVIYTVHGPRFPHRGRQALFQRLPVTDRIVTVSDFIRRDAVEKAGVKAQNVITIRNGIDLGRFGGLTPDALRGKKLALGLEADSVVIGVVARLSPEKDHRTLLEAFSLVSSEYPDARLIVIGDGDMLPLLRKQAVQLGVGDFVYFLGKREDVSELLCTLDVFVLPSREEGLGITLLEAMAAGIPVVATNVGGIPEIVEHHVTGLLVPPGNPRLMRDAITTVLTNPGLANSLTNSARKRVSDAFSMATMVREYEELYRRVMEE